MNIFHFIWISDEPSYAYQFLREQAALAADEITADAVNDFVADLKDGTEYEETFSKPLPNERKSIWEKIIAIAEESTSGKQKDGLLPVKSGVGLPKINGKHSKSAQKMSIKINGNPMTRDDALNEFIYGNIPMYKEVLPGLESWKAGKIALWHSVEGHSVKWFCVVCIDRKGNNLLSCSRVPITVIYELMFLIYYENGHSIKNLTKLYCKIL